MESISKHDHPGNGATHEMHGNRGEHPTSGRSHSGHERHAGHSVAMFRDKFWLSFALTIPVVFWSGDVQHWFGYAAPSFPGSQLIAPVLGTIVFLYGGLVFIRGAWNEIADRKPGMMTLISLGITVAFGTSLAGTFGLLEIEVWWELATLTTIMILGHWLEMRAVSQARGALSTLAALLPDTAERVIGQTTQTVPLSELQVGDIVLVRPGARVPADGTVVEGAAEVDESLITGESRPVQKGVGAAVVAGTVAGGGSLRVRITALGEETALSGIMRLVAAAQASGSRTQALADRAAATLFYVAVAAGAITMAYWWVAGDKEHALTRTATVLIIACPHALGLAIPLVIAISTSLGAQNGLLVKDRLALERARDLDVVVFDKTGTLTRGAPALSDVVAATGVSEDDLFSRAAAVESDSEHPLGKAIVAEAKRRGLPPLHASHFEALPGRGAQALVGRERVSVGGPHLLAERNLAPSPQLAEATAAWAAEGKTVLFVVSQNGVLGAFAVEDEIRPESKEAVEELHRLGIRVAMITGDSKTVAESVARRIGIDDVAAEVLPADKASAIQRFKAGGKHVAMVGDGVNDAPALVSANVGIAIGAGTDVAVESAGIVLMRSDPRDVVGAIELSRATYRKMVQNLIWATAYNLVAIPVAAGLLVRWGFDLPMSVGALAMSLSTLIVAVNAQFLRRLKLGRRWTADRCTQSPSPVLGVLAGALVLLMSGCTASKKPSKLETTLANIAKDVVIPLEAQNLKNPAPATDENIQAGQGTYLQQCALCHAADGHAATKLGLAMYPPAMDLNSPHVQRWTDAELFWIIQNGVRLTGMPAWKTIVSEQDTWKVVNFIHALPKLAPILAEQQKGAEAAKSQAELVAYGRKLYRQEGCWGCHQLDGDGGKVGPDLTVEGTRGRSDEWLVGHFKDPSAYTPGSVMFSFKQLTDEQLRALTAFLQTQKGPKPK